MVSCAAEPDVVSARVAEGWQCIRMGMGAGNEDMTEVQYSGNEGAAKHKNVQGPRATKPAVDPDLYEPRVSIANSIRDFTACRFPLPPSKST